VLLNGAAALVLLVILGQAPEGTADRKVAAAMMFFSGGAMAALPSAFLAYINRTVRMESPDQASVRRILRAFAIAAVIGSGAAFLTGMNMVASTSEERSSSHPKGPREGQPPVSSPGKSIPPVTAPNEKAAALGERLSRSRNLAREIGPDALYVRGKGI
jgi:zinc transporter ZupT